MPRDTGAPLRWLAIVVAILAAALSAVVISAKSGGDDVRLDRTERLLFFRESYWDGQVRTDSPVTFTAMAWVTTDADSVYIRIENLNFWLSLDGTPVEGYLYSLSALPESQRPSNLVGHVTPAPCFDSSSACYGYWVRPDGSITLQSRDGGPLPARPGWHSVPETTIVFHRNESPAAPRNVRLGSNRTDLIGSVMDEGGFDYLDYYAMDAAGGNATTVRLAFIWPDNSGSQPRRNLNVAFRRADVSPNGAVAWAPASLALPTSDLVFCSESKVAIDPTDLEHIAVAATCIDMHYEPFTTGWQWTAVVVSDNGGASWSEPVQPWPLSSLPFDPWIAMDAHGHCYVSSGVVLEPGNWFAAGALSVMLSVDGCRSFGSELLSVPTADLLGGGYIDFPKIAVGPGALWFSGDDAQYTVSRIVPTIGYLPVSGLGQFGAPVWFNAFDNIPVGDCGIGLSEIAVNGDTGAVYWLSTNICDGSGRSDARGDATRVSLWVAPGGTAGFGPSAFLPRRDIQWNNMGISPGGEITTRRTPWAPNRGIGPKGIRALSYGAGRLVYAGLDMRPAQSNQTYVTLAYSDNEGQTWSDGITVNSDNTVFAGMPSIATSGPVTGVMWLDPRGDDEGIAPYAVVLRKD